MAKKKVVNKKMELVILAVLARMTDFELQTMDDELVEEIEEFREYICSYKQKEK